MVNFLDYTRPRGYLEIIKTQNGQDEVIFSDYNDICIGMGQTLAGMFDPNNSDKTIQDYRIKYFQIGQTAGTDGSATRNCEDPLTGSEYGANTSLGITYRKVYNNSQPTQAMAVITNQHILRGGNDRVTYVLTLDENTANTTIAEVALLSHEPILNLTGASPVVAYRTFPTITKTSAFTLTIKWTIEF